MELVHIGNSVLKTSAYNILDTHFIFTMRGKLRLQSCAVCSRHGSLTREFTKHDASGHEALRKSGSREACAFLNYMLFVI